MSLIRCIGFFILGLLLTYNNTMIAQEEVSQVNIAVQDLVLNTEKVVFENNELKVSLHKVELEDVQNGFHHERITFHYTNKTSEILKVKFNKLNIYSGSTSRGEGRLFEIELDGNSTKEYSQVNKGKTYYSFSKDLKGTIKAELKFIILNNIIIS